MNLTGGQKSIYNESHFSTRAPTWWNDWLTDLSLVFTFFKVDWITFMSHLILHHPSLSTRQCVRRWLVKERLFLFDLNVSRPVCIRCVINLNRDAADLAPLIYASKAVDEWMNEWLNRSLMMMMMSACANDKRPTTTTKKKRKKHVIMRERTWSRGQTHTDTHSQVRVFD